MPARLAILAACGVAVFALFAVSAPERSGPATPDTPAAATPPSVAEQPAAPAAAEPGLRSRSAAPLPPLHLAGRVVDTGGGAVAGAQVFLDDDASRGGTTPLATATTDATGAYTLTAERAPGAGLELHVRHPHHPPFARAETTPPPPQLADVSLAIGAGIEGRVVTLEGRPLPGATVELHGAWPRELRTARDRPHLARAFATAADGGFRFGALAAGQYRVEVAAPRMQHRGTAATVTLREGDTVDIGAVTLAPATRVEGVVTDAAGVPIAGARVEVSSRGDGAFRAHLRTGDDGHFAVDHAPRTPLALTASAAQHLTWHGTADPALTGPLWIRLERGLTLRGTVVDAASGEPITAFAARPVRLGTVPAPAGDDSLGAREALGTSGGPETNPPPIWNLPRPATTGFDPASDHPGGAFVLEGLDAGRVAVDVAAPGYAPTRSAITELRPGAQAPEVVVELHRARRITGIVLGDGEPVAGASVELALPAGTGASEEPFAGITRRARRGGSTTGPRIAATTSDGAGRFSFADLRPAEYLVVARHEAFRIAILTVAVDGDVLDIDIELPRGAELHGSVTDLPPGARTAKIVAYGGPGRVHRTVVAEDGTYLLRGLDAGRWVVRAHPTDPMRALAREPGLLQLRERAALPADVVLRAGERRRHDLRLAQTPAAAVAGTIEADGEPLADAQVSIPRIATVRSDDRGAFRIASVPPGEWQLRVRPPGGTGHHVRTIRVASDRENLVTVVLRTGAIDARITDASGASLDGSATFLPGLRTAPQNLAEHVRAGGPAHPLAVRDGRLLADRLPAGPGLLVVTCGRRRIEAPVVVPQGGTARIDLIAATTDDR